MRYCYIYSHTSPYSNLNTLLSSLVTIKSFQTPGTSTPAGTVADYTFTPSLTGYSCKGIIGVNIAAGQSITLISFYMNGTSGDILVRTRNNGTGTATPQTVSVYCLFVKNL